MRVGTGIGGWPGEAAGAAKRVEEAGYDYVTCGELSHDSMVLMAVAATGTERVQLQTGVTIAFPRSPMVLAMEAWDIQQMSRGRFVLGLGSQVKGHNERRFGGTWSPPAPRMKEYIQMLHAIWDSWQEGRTPEFLGKQYRYTLMTPNFNPGPIEFPRPKVYLAVVGEAMARVAGEVADGVLPHGGIMTNRYMREVMLPNIRIGLERAGRTWDDIDIGASGYLALGDDDDEILRNVDRFRQPLHFYGSTRTYHHVLRMHGLEELGMKLHALSLEGRWQEMRDTITIDDLLKLAETCRNDDYPEFLQNQREYASMVGWGIGGDTEDAKARSRAIMTRIQQIETSGVPEGLALG